MQLFLIYLFLQTLYMFQAVPPPIIRSTYLYIQLRVLLIVMIELNIFLINLYTKSQDKTYMLKICVLLWRTQMAEPSQRPTTKNACKTRGCNYSFWALMMSGVSPETCWAIKKHWNNKFYYTLASCWFFLWDFYYDARFHEHQEHQFLMFLVTVFTVRYSTILYNMCSYEPRSRSFAHLTSTAPS